MRTTLRIPLLVGRGLPMGLVIGLALASAFWIAAAPIIATVAVRYT